jgi:aubergine-like protein
MNKPNYNPGVALILCNKKINQRIFMENGKNFYMNPNSGTVVGKDLEKSELFEFYLTAQYVNQGTCTPAQFTIVYNTTKLSEDAFWSITYEQCFNYMNWQGAVRVPGCLMYANKLSKLIGEHIREKPNDKLLCQSLYCL